MRAWLVVVALLGAVPAGAAETVALDTEERLGELCRALQPPERQRFSGTPAERGQARAAFLKEHERAKRRSLTLELAWGEFAVSEWDAAEKVVRIATEKPFRAFAGSLALFDPAREDLELEAAEGEAAALKAALAKGEARLRLLFRPSEEEGTSCVVSKAKSYALSIDLLGAELRAGPKLLARGTRDGLQPIPSADGAPTVEIRSALGADCADCSAEIVAQVSGGAAPLLACYRAALARKPALDGAYVFDVVAGAGGALSAQTVIADSLDDAQLLSCAKAALAGGKAARPGHAQVLVEFGRK